jgi:hypothetical protein
VLLHTNSVSTVYVLNSIAVAPAAMFRLFHWPCALRGVFCWLSDLPLNGGSLPRRLLVRA